MKRRSSAKRLVALALCLRVTAATLPSSAYAAIGDLTKNTARENQSILERLENFTATATKRPSSCCAPWGCWMRTGSSSPTRHLY